MPAKLARAQCRAPPERAYSRWEPPSNLSGGCKKARGNALLWLKAYLAGLMRDVYWPVVRVSVLEIFEMVQGLFAVE